MLNSLTMSKRIYLVDDDPIYTFSMKAMLRQIGFEGDLKIYENGEEAYEGIKEHSDKGIHELVLLDLNMPVMDGWEFLDAVSANGVLTEQMRIYIVTSSISPDDEAKAKSIDTVDGFLVKPVDRGTLKEIIYHRS